MQIVAITFVKFDEVSYKLSFENTNVYYYADPFMLKRDDLALVHNGKEFGLVRVARAIDLSHMISKRVEKPILMRANYEEEIVSKCREAIVQFKLKNKDSEIQSKIDFDLEPERYYRDRATGELRERRRALPTYQLDANDSEDRFAKPSSEEAPGAFPMGDIPF